MRHILPALALTALAALAQNTPDEFMSAGNFEAALEGYKAATVRAPKSVAAWQGAGSAADLLGRYDEAHKHFEQAIRAASAPNDQVQALRAMAISWAFAGDCRAAERYSRRAFDHYFSRGDRTNAGEAANEIGRICLELGDINRGSDWYERAHNTITQEEDLPDARADLWNYRYAHARARIAARQGKHDEARKQVTRAKAILDRRRIPEQDAYFPYLTGYTAFYAGDFKAALAQLQQALQNDVFILNLMAQCYEKLGDTANTVKYYRMAASVTSHTLNAALAQPYATRWLKAR